MLDPKCVFCDPRKIESEVDLMYAADSSEHYVFEPLAPVVPGHLLVVPTTHVMDATEDPYVFAMAASVASRVAQRYSATNIITSVGSVATQSVFHLHIHVVPRRRDDGLSLPWSP
jgi:histidine triad (HIT) family protein